MEDVGIRHGRSITRPSLSVRSSDFLGGGRIYQRPSKKQSTLSAGCSDLGWGKIRHGRFIRPVDLFIGLVEMRRVAF